MPVRPRTRLVAGVGSLCVGVAASLFVVAGPAGAAPPGPATSDPAATPARTGVFWGAAAGGPARPEPPAAGGSYDPGSDPGSLYNVDRATGARTAWRLRDAAGQPLTGQGVGVALLDTGIDDRVPGLDAPGKVTYGPDLSIEANGPLADADTFGHGTFLAGIIAGRGTADSDARLAGEPAGVQLGVAPDAKLLAMKLATTDGSTDVTQVIAALDWVTEHPTLPDGTRIRVINLSYGTGSRQDYRLDPLAAAAENAWKHGIVVVTSAGNDAAAGVTDPASDPYVLAVGATDSGGAVNGWSGARAAIASFSDTGTAARPLDLVAPGTSLVSLRDPGSFVDVHNPQGLVAGDASGTLFRGSGTSQAAAVVSGAAALLLQAFPSLTPDQVKFALTASASPLRSATGVAGAASVDVPGALAVAALMTAHTPLGAVLRARAAQHFAAATGQGSLDAARGGGAPILDPTGTPITGELDVMGRPWDPAAWWRAASTLTAWSGGRWLGEDWTGAGWQWVSDGSLGSWRWEDARWDSWRWESANWDAASWTSWRWESWRWEDASWDSWRWEGARWS